MNFIVCVCGCVGVLHYIIRSTREINRVFVKRNIVYFVKLGKGHRDYRVNYAKSNKRPRNSITILRDGRDFVDDYQIFFYYL